MEEVVLHATFGSLVASKEDNKQCLVLSSSLMPDESFTLDMNKNVTSSYFTGSYTEDGLKVLIRYFQEILNKLAS